MKIDEIVETTLNTARNVQSVKDACRLKRVEETIKKLRALKGGDPERIHADAEDLLFDLLQDFAFDTPAECAIHDVRDAFDELELWYA